MFFFSFSWYFVCVIPSVSIQYISQLLYLIFLFNLSNNMQIIFILFLYLYSVILFILWLKRPYNQETGINVDHNSTAVPYLMPLQQTKPLLAQPLLVDSSIRIRTHLPYCWTVLLVPKTPNFMHSLRPYDGHLYNEDTLYPFVFTLRSLDCMQKFFLRLHRLFVVLNLRSMPELRVLTVMFTFP